MADTTFIDRSTPIVADWLNDVNDTVYGLPSTASGKGAALVGALDGGTLKNYSTDLWLSPAADGAVGDDTNNDLVAIQATVAKANATGNKTIVFSGKYYLGTFTGPNQTLFDITAENVTLVFLSGTKFRVTANSSLVEIFRANGASRLNTIGELYVETDAGTTYTTDGTAGARAFVVNNNAAANNYDISIDRIRLKRGAVGLLVYGTNSATFRTKGVRANSVYTEDATYGVNCASNGDDVTVLDVVTYNAYRSWFSYNCVQHKGNVKSFDHHTGGTCVNLTRFSTTQGGAASDTEDMDISVTVNTPQSNVTVLTLRFIGDEGGSAQKLRDIKVRMNANADATGLTPVSMLNFLTSGGSVTATTFASVMSGIAIECNLPASGTSNFITFSGANWATKPEVYWRGSFVAAPDAQAVALASIALKVTEASTWVSFTPTITGSTTVGAGTYTTQTGRYTRIGNTVHFTLRLAWTAHTGTGNMRISGMPYAVSASSDHITYPAWFQNIALTANNVLYTLHTTGTTNITLQQALTGGGAISNVPIDTAGEIIVSGTYPID